MTLLCHTQPPLVHTSIGDVPEPAVSLSEQPSRACERVADQRRDHTPRRCDGRHVGRSLSSFPRRAFLFFLSPFPGSTFDETQFSSSRTPFGTFSVWAFVRVECLLRQRQAYTHPMYVPIPTLGKHRPLPHALAHLPH